MKLKRKIVAAAASAVLIATGCQVTTNPPVGIFHDSYTPSTVKNVDAGPLELGLKFSPTQDGTLEGVQYYQNEPNHGVTTVSVWSSAGVRLTQVLPYTNTTVGWRTVPVDVPMTAGQNYTVSIYDSNGNYPATSKYFTLAKTTNTIDTPVSAGVYKYSATSAFPTQSYNYTNYLLDVVFRNAVSDPEPTPTPDPTPDPTPTPTPTPDPTPTPEPTPTPPTGPTQHQYLGQSWPDASVTGVPAGTNLTPYTGPCTISTANTVIDSKQVGCRLVIQAPNVLVTNSYLTEGIHGVASASSGGSFIIRDSTVALGDKSGTGIGERHFTAERVEVTGGNRGINCYVDCIVRDSYVHAGFSDEGGTFHMSGIRMNTNSLLVHNTIGCTAPDIEDSGCSAAVTGYPDFDPTSGNTMDNNLILGNSGGYCTYGGNTQGKPYSNDPLNATHITFKDNVWQRGDANKCGFFGPVVAFDSSEPTNLWSNNRYTDGAVINP